MKKRRSVRCCSHMTASMLPAGVAAPVGRVESRRVESLHTHTMLIPRANLNPGQDTRSFTHYKKSNSALMIGSGLFLGGKGLKVVFRCVHGFLEREEMTGRVAVTYSIPVHGWLLRVRGDDREGGGYSLSRWMNGCLE